MLERRNQVITLTLTPEIAEYLDRLRTQPQFMYQTRQAVICALVKRTIKTPAKKKRGAR